MICYKDGEVFNLFINSLRSSSANLLKERLDQFREDVIQDFVDKMFELIIQKYHAKFDLAEDIDKSFSDLGLDMFDVDMMAAELENFFGIEIPNSKLEKLENISDVYRFLVNEIFKVLMLSKELENM